MITDKTKITNEEALAELEAFQKMIGLRLDKVELYIKKTKKNEILLGLYDELITKYFGKPVDWDYLNDEEQQLMIAILEEKGDVIE